METPLHTHVACPLNPYGVLQIILHRKNANVPCFMVKLPYELHILQISCTVKITHAIRVLGAILLQIHFAKDWIVTSISCNQLLVLRRTKPYASTKPNLFKYLNNLLVIRMTLVCVIRSQWQCWFGGLLDFLSCVITSLRTEQLHLRYNGYCF